jgi:uncharacterized membrane protein YfcA
VVFFNALSGSFAYARMKRIDYRSGIIFAVATIPGAILGALSTAYVPRHSFDIAFGILMVLAGAFLWFSARDDHDHAVPYTSGAPVPETPRNRTMRDFVDDHGTRYHYSYNSTIGIVLSVFVGFLSSLLGVGGGFIHVPALTGLLNFPVHVATATSHFVLAVMALTGTVTHVATGVFAHGIRRTAVLSVGVVLGAQTGARLSHRVGGKWILRGLALAMIFVGIRLLITEL